MMTESSREIIKRIEEHLCGFLLVDQIENIFIDWMVKNFSEVYLSKF